MYNMDKQSTNSTLAKEIGRNLRKLLDHHNLSIRGVGRAIGVAQPHLTRIIRGMHKSPGIEIVSKIADYFGIKIESLLSKDGQGIDYNTLKAPVTINSSSVQRATEEAMNIEESTNLKCK